MGFTVSAVDDDVDEGGRTGSVVIYQGKDCKIQVFCSSREGEINAMIGPLDAPNVHGLYDPSRRWHYFNDFADLPELSLEKLVHNLRDEHENFTTPAKWLEWLRTERIARYYESAHEAISELQ
ncbi:hypothetical protein A5647_17675 [Mycobacterium sp. 1100029.7]|nr:hypothetical protein A5647_17675 [Mycobacterium sp. 1100029.7]